MVGALPSVLPLPEGWLMVGGVEPRLTPGSASEPARHPCRPATSNNIIPVRKNLRFMASLPVAHPSASCVGGISTAGASQTHRISAESAPGLGAYGSKGTP